MAVSRLQKTVEANIGRLNLLDHDNTYLVALSGGADSVALMLLMADMGYHIHAVHCNFHLRGAESDRDEAFVKSLTAAHGVPLHLAHFDTRSYAALHHQSIETAARNLRYAYFENLRRDIGAGAILVAHHRDDNAETVLMNLVRGTGINGLSGIRYVNGNIIRPLLCVSRGDIEEYLSERKQDYVTDSTNLEDEATRNKIRLNIMPQLAEINPAAPDNIAAAAEHVSEGAKIIDWAVAKAKEEAVVVKGAAIEINKAKLASFPSPHYILNEICREYGFVPAQTGMMYESLDGQPGKMFHSSTHDLVIDRECILIAPQSSAGQSSSNGNHRAMRIPECGTYVFGDMKISVSLMSTSAQSFSVSKSADKVCLDSSSVKFPLVIRNTMAGDRFAPFGMRGTKLVSDYLTDRKKNLFEKQRQLVVEDADGEIIWLVGERASNKCRVTDNTKEALVLTIINN